MYRMIARRLPEIATLAIATLIAVTPAVSAEYFVSSTKGADKGSGDATAPFRTLAKATSALAPGDTLHIAEGRYTERLLLAQSGTDQQPIRVVGSGRPLIETSDDPILISGSYIEVSGLEAHSTGLGSAITIGKNNHHVRVSNNIARDSGCGGIATIQTDYVTIEENRVFGNSRRSPWQCSGISIYQPTNSDHASGIHNAIRRNIVYDNMNVFVDDNISRSDGRTTDGNGIIIDDSRHTQGGAPPDAYDGLTIVENNIVFDNGGRGVNVFLSDHALVRNNTSYHNLKDTNLAWRENQGEFTSAYASDVKFVNNIAVPSDIDGHGFAALQTNSECLWDFNLIQGGIQSRIPRQNCGSHNKFERQNAGFVLPSIDPREADFHLRADSPAIGAGDVSETPKDDFSGSPRPQNGPTDLGALRATGADR
jgi:parallel beta-helix repeat protein